MWVYSKCILITSINFAYFAYYISDNIIMGDFYMGIAYRKRTDTKYVQYTTRLREETLNKIREIAHKEDLSINEVINQSLESAVKDYNFKKK